MVTFFEILAIFKTDVYFLNFRQNFIYFHFLKITTKFSQKQETIIKICRDFINDY